MPPSFTNGRIDDCLLHVRPHLDQMLFQLIHVTYELLVHTFLNTAPNLITTGLRSGLLGGHRSGDMNSGVAWRRYSTVARHMHDGPARYPAGTRTHRLPDVGLQEESRAIAEHLGNKHRLPSLPAPQRSVQCIQVMRPRPTPRQTC